jgi:hypothetical protein
MRACFQCKREDRPVQTLRDCNCGQNPHDPECDSIEHWVKPEIRFLKREVDYTARDKAQGWTYKLFQGRPAMERFSCIPCIRQADETARRVKHVKDLAKKAESGSNLNIYQILTS